MRYWQGVHALGFVYEKASMTIAETLSSMLRRCLRALALLVCFASILTAQVALAADQVEDLSALGTPLAEADGCAPSSLTDIDTEEHERGQRTTHCQSCCFHHNGQTGAVVAQVDHEDHDTGDRLALGLASRLTSAALAAEKDPPRA